ncbi:MAG: AzlD domain-containing protein [Dehalococcoidales bacterium]|nr:AzlD domain-containing protein [Dehalococcoidales bacterium]
MAIGVWDAIAIFAVIAVVTWITRALPFALFGNKKAVPKLISYLGKVLPGAIMATLVIYCLRLIDLTEFPFGLAELLSVIVVAAIHIWKRNIFWSISSGTLCYMILIRTVFAL